MEQTLVSGAPKVGDVLAGKYRVERGLGSGGMGVVLSAMHLDLEERVAIKLLLPHVAQNPETVSRFVREARAAIKIRSEHVVRVLDVGRLESGGPFMVMEYLEGSDLASLVGRIGPLSVPVAVDYLLQACEAIAEAHALGIVHRDLKPGNLFLTQHAGGAPCIKVLDFGISKVAGVESSRDPALTSTSMILGTPSFMSPEQMRSTRDVDARADLWSLGAILYALLSGAPPYEGESTADVCAKIIRDPPPPLRNARPDVPEPVAAAVARCLEKPLEKRFQNVAELAAALAEFGTVEAKASLARITSIQNGARGPDGRLLPHGAGPPLSQPTPPTPEWRVTPEWKAAPTPEWRVVVSKEGNANPTRTASAWEDTRLQTTLRRRRGAFAALLAATGGAAVALGVLLVLATPRGHEAAQATGPVAPPPTAAPLETAPPPASALAAWVAVSATAAAATPSPDAAAVAPQPPSTSTAAVVAAPAPPRVASPQSGSSKPAGAPARTGARAPAGSAPGSTATSTGGLFDDRK